MFLCTLTMVPLLYNLDFVDGHADKKKSKVEANANIANENFV